MNLSVPVQLKNILNRIPYELKYALLLFVVTRCVLTLIGVLSKTHLPPVCHVHDWFHTGHAWLDIWASWDSEWYIRIAKEWYPPEVSASQSNYGFFPLYPLLVRILKKALIGNYLVSGIAVSSICLLTAAVFLYRLVRLSDDERTARRAVKYLFLYPSAFVLSGVFSEALFLALAILCFYCARKEKWFLCGMAGCLLSLTRSNGVLILAPISYEYLRLKGFSLKNLKPDLLFLGAMPLGALAFSAYCFLHGGDWLAYVHAKQQGWHMAMGNPFVVLWVNLLSDSIPLRFNAIFAIVIILALTAFCRKIGFAYWLFGMITIFLVLSYGLGDPRYAGKVMTSMYGTARFSLDIFPLYILFAKLGADERVDGILTIALALLQGGLMIFWAISSPMIV